MPQHKLTNLFIERIRRPKLYSDGGGLYLQVTRSRPDGPLNKSWVYRYRTPQGRLREMGLGTLAAVGLSKAREKAAAARTQISDGIDPITYRQTQRKKAAADEALQITFKEAAEKFIEVKRPTWTNEKHAKQWGSTLKKYAYPIFGGIPVGQVDRSHVLEVLEPIWWKKKETASRVRSRIENILDWAAAKDWRQGDNPARWKGNLDKLLFSRDREGVKHHPRMPIDELPTFIARLQDEQSLAGFALELLILTATRTREVTEARWEEFNLNKLTWTIPANRMKARCQHVIPLSNSALAILNTAKAWSRDDGWVFPGIKAEKPLSDMAMLMLLRRMELHDITVHGFRSTFRDWVAERTDFDGDVAEMALAHVIKNKVERAYRRGNLLEKRVLLMTQWAAFCESGSQAKLKVGESNQLTASPPRGPVAEAA